MTDTLQRIDDTLRQVLREHLEAEARHDAKAAAATYVEDSYYENAAFGLTFRGRDMVEFQYTLSFQFVEGLTAQYLWEHEGPDYVVHVGRVTGRVGDNVLGVPATGGPVDFPFTAVITFRDGKMLGEHIYYEPAEFCRQAGADYDAVMAAAQALRG